MFVIFKESNFSRQIWPWLYVRVKQYRHILFSKPSRAFSVSRCSCRLANHSTLNSSSCNIYSFFLLWGKLRYAEQGNGDLLVSSRSLIIGCSRRNLTATTCEGHSYHKWVSETLWLKNFSLSKNHLHSQLTRVRGNSSANSPEKQYKIIKTIILYLKYNIYTTSPISSATSRPVWRNNKYFVFDEQWKLTKSFYCPWKRFFFC